MEGVWKKSLMVLILALFTGHLVFGQDDYAAEVEKLKNQFPAGTIPDLSNISSALPFEKVTEKLKEKCQKEAGSDAAYEEAQQAAGKVQECLSGLLDWNTLIDEVEKAKPTGDLEIVFNKYCRRRNTALECVKNFTAAATPCLSAAENDQKHMFEKMLEKLLGFVCHKDGDQIALFIAEKGPECFGSKKDEMWRCVNETYGEKISVLMGMKDNLDPEKLEELAKNELPTFTIERSDCEKLEQVEACISDVLEQCDETTPANLFQSAAKFVRNESPCQNVTRKFGAKKGNGGGAAGVQAVPFLIGAAFMAAMVKLGL